MADSLGIFKTGTLMMEHVSGDVPAAVAADGGDGLSVPLLVVLTVACTLVFFRNIANALPPVFRCLFMQRGCARLESSVRMSMDRNLTALLMVLPFCLVLDLTGIFDPDLLRGLDEGLHLAATAAFFIAYLLLRLAIYMALKPRSVPDSYMLSRKETWNFFIIMFLAAAVTGGVSGLLHAGKAVAGSAILLEIGLLYIVMLVRRGRILALSCNPFTVFLYLCALEIVPTGLYVAAALIL